jgi:hypothetical protein
MPDATSPCFNALTSGQQLSAIWSVLVEILQHFDPMADPNPLDGAAVPCFHVLTSGQQLSSIWSMLALISTSITAGANYGGNGDPNGVITAAINAVYVQWDAPGTIWLKTIDGGNTGWAINS